MSQIGLLVCMTAGLAALFAPAMLSRHGRAAPRLVFNVSDSAPRGFYAVSTLPVARGDYVVARLPAAMAALAAERRYLPANIPLLKHVAAMYGDHVCVRNGMVRVNGKVLALTLTHDSQGRLLTSWVGCRILTESEWFLLSTDNAASFDSRYFGPVPRAAAYGRAAPVWTWTTP
ncbi:S26 family signal peptidase [Bordetella tumulicola]|uniref:S26 family signal peptidase n=1 Tax=Bordetella tumulicola TaxID=1649133 RepID=UPI0039EF0F76